MGNLDKKIKIKLQSLVESRINEDVAATLEQLMAKYGQKFVNLFSDDVIRAAEVNLGDDAVKLMAKSVNNATLLSTVNGEKVFLTQHNRDVPLNWIIGDLDKINRGTATREFIMNEYGDLQLKNGTYIRDFFKKPPPPKPPTPKGEFRRGFGAPSPLKLALNVLRSPRIKLFKKETRIPKEDFIKLGGWLSIGAGDLNQVIEICNRPGMELIKKIYLSSVNLGGQYAGRIWWWTWRLTLLNLLRDSLTDTNAPKKVYKDSWEALVGSYSDNNYIPDFITGTKGRKKGRIERALEVEGYKFVSMAYNIYSIIKPISVYIWEGEGKSGVLEKTHIIQKIDDLIKSTYQGLLAAASFNDTAYKWMKSIKQDNNIIKDPQKRRAYRQLRRGNLKDPAVKDLINSTIDSSADYIDPVKIFGQNPQTNTSGANTQQPQQQSQQPQPQPQPIKRTVKNPFEGI